MHAAAMLAQGHLTRLAMGSVISVMRFQWRPSVTCPQTKEVVVAFDEAVGDYVHVLRLIHGPKFAWSSDGRHLTSWCAGVQKRIMRDTVVSFADPSAWAACMVPHLERLEIIVSLVQHVRTLQPAESQYSIVCNALVPSSDSHLALLMLLLHLMTIGQSGRLQKLQSVREDGI